MNGKLSSLLCVVAAMFFLQGCAEKKYEDIKQSVQDTKCDVEFKKLNLCAKLKWSGPVIESTVLSYDVIFSPLNAAKPTATTVELKKAKPWMSEHGHGTNRPGVISVTEPSKKFTVTNVRFSMPGTWSIEFAAEGLFEGRVQEEVKYTIEVAESN